MAGGPWGNAITQLRLRELLSWGKLPTIRCTESLQRLHELTCLYVSVGPPGEQHLAAFRAHLLELSLSGSGLEPGADMFQLHATANYPLHCVPGRPYKSSHAEMLEQGLPGTVSTSFRGSPDGIELSQHRA